MLLNKPPVMIIKQKIIELSDQILDYLLEYRKTHPAFRFWMRSREHNRSGDGERLSKGQWFQGSDYIFLSFFSASGHVNMTRSIGWVLELDNKLNPRYHVAVVWPTETDQRKIDLYFDIIKELGGFKKHTETRYQKDLPDNGPIESLNDFVERTLPQINNLIRKHGLTEVFTIPEEKFQAQLERVLTHRQQLKRKSSLPLTKTTNEKSISMNNDNFPINLVLYGPPGTGKTYHSINEALAILGDDTAGKSREAIKEIYNKRVDEKRIEFITFHQSMSYEDFIEGIKPVKPDNTTTLLYEIVDGIFKRICIEATKVTQFSVTIDNVSKPLTKELFESFYYSFSETLPLHTEQSSTVQLKTKENYPFDLFKNTADSIVVKAGQKRTNSTVSLNELSAVLFENKTPTYKSYEQIIIEKILEDKNFQKSSVDNTEKRYVLIIDEINRGNVSQIFGELITLIEGDKRKGEIEELSVTLPYSKKLFSVPSNLYIIGTMNTADRSVEALDTALRRRFAFKEIEPKPELLSPERLIWNLWWKHDVPYWDNEPYASDEKKLYSLLGVQEEFGHDGVLWKLMRNEKKEEQIELLKPLPLTGKGVNLQVLLETINKRLEVLLSKDHKIGHAWLMNVYSLDDLRTVFKNKILPLLTEYFYNDYAKIGLILGKAFVKSTTVQAELFSNFHEAEELASEYNDRIVYSLNDPMLLDIKDFQSIYGR
jgi:5-methylcytosine-specific restriction endonuclease McrBC GTP-binding regulatory subunit McrB